MKNKHIIHLLPLLVIPVISSGCTKPGSEKINTSQTQIYVNNFKRGFGGDWLADYKTKFEAKYADVSFENGKKGVQVIISNSGAPADSRISNILSGRDEVYFTEQTSYFTLLQNDVVLDLTSMVKEKLEGETRSIEDKMSEGQKNYLDYKGKYYAIPHYSGYFGLTYDADLFAKKKFYLVAEPVGTTLDGKFMRYDDDEKSAGPDGVKGTYDDGLPATYNEFYDLCEYMIKKNCTPMIADGQNAGGYINLLVNQLAANNEGREQMELIYSCNGTMTNLGSVDANGNKTKLGPTPITPATGYEAYRMLGKYDAIKWYETCYKNKYFYNKIDSNGYSAGNAQNDFLRSSITGASNLNPVGMISEGNWWVAEASTSFDKLSDTYGEEWKSANRNLQFMPLPKAEAGNGTNTIFDHLSALMFVKKNVAEWKIPLISEFVKFVNTDESLQSFSVITNTMKALNYEISDENLAKMTSFGKSLYNIQKTADIVYPFNSSDYFQNNSTFYKYGNQYWSKVGGVNNQYLSSGIKNGASAEEYFTGMYAYYKNDWANRNL